MKWLGRGRQSTSIRQEGQQHSNLLVATVSKLLHGLRGVEGRKSNPAPQMAFFSECCSSFRQSAKFFLCESVLRPFPRSVWPFFLSPSCPPVGWSDPSRGSLNFLHLRDCCLCGRLLVASAQHALAATVPSGVDAASRRRVRFDMIRSMGAYENAIPKSPWLFQYVSILK